MWNELPLLDFIQNDPVGYAVPFFVLLILLEVGLDMREKRQWYEKKEAWASLAMGVGSVFVNLAAKIFYLGIFLYLYENYRLFTLPTDSIAAWVLLFFLDDFSFYWHHRLSHQIRILWASHSNHHSSVSYNLAVALRQSWTEFLYKYLFWLWLPLIGFHPLMVFTMIACSLIYQFFLHTQSVRKLGFLEYVFNTPSHHRVHHATNVQYLDKNHAGILIIWDRLFGTFIEETETPIYGLTTNIQTHNPIAIAFAEHRNIWQDLKKAPRWQDKLKYLFYPPGWSHTGDSQTTQSLQRKAQQP
jgi:sterol desaturase/sphingolipid hydroxylase (fatty acid hydroxylase superfamily)